MPFSFVQIFEEKKTERKIINRIRSQETWTHSNKKYAFCHKKYAFCHKKYAFCHKKYAFCHKKYAFCHKPIGGVQNILFAELFWNNWMQCDK